MRQFNRKAVLLNDLSGEQIHSHGRVLPNPGNGGIAEIVTVMEPEGIGNIVVYAAIAAFEAFAILL